MLRRVALNIGLLAELMSYVTGKDFDNS